MALTDYKIVDTDISTHGLQAAPDKLTGTAAENKSRFDRLVVQVVKEKLNGLIDSLISALAGKMDAPPTMGVTGQFLKVGESGMEWDVPGGSGDMIRAVYDTDNDGVVDSADSAGVCSGNAATASALQTARSFALADNSGANVGSAVSFDGSGDVQLRLPAHIRANLSGNVDGNINGSAATAASAGVCTGNAATATVLQTARSFALADSSGTNVGSAVSFNGSANVQLRLPAAISADLYPGLLIAGSELVGEDLPADPVEGQIFFQVV